MPAFAKTTRTAQVLATILDRKREGQEWGGMVMFLKQQVAMNDPRMASVYKNFECNLKDIIEVGRCNGVGIVLSTVGSNLKDCPPLASVHRANLSDQDLRQGKDFGSAD